MIFPHDFADFDISPTLSAKLSWSHFIEQFPLKSRDGLYQIAEQFDNFSIASSTGTTIELESFLDSCSAENQRGQDFYGLPH